MILITREVPGRRDEYEGTQWVREECYRFYVRFHGVLAPIARLRAEIIIPSAPVDANTPSADHDQPPPLAPAHMRCLSRFA